MTTQTRKSLYDPAVYEECLSRLETIDASTEPQWGSMTAAQMMAHCAEIVEVTNGKPLENTPFIVKLFKGMIRNLVVNEKPYKKNSQTHPQYKQTRDKDFDTEKKRLLGALETFHHMDEAQIAAVKHPLFGTMTKQEKGWSMYKHLDHHLTQFGA